MTDMALARLGGGIPTYKDLTLSTAVTMSDLPPDMLELLQLLNTRINSIRVEQERFRLWCMRADDLYYAENWTDGGADLWADHPDVGVPGRSHVSVNTPATYVDVPAALQAVEPIENMMATDTTKGARTAASAFERLYYAWKDTEEYELKFHKACTVKALYGRTASKIYYDKDAEGGARPCVEIVEQPRNLWIGYKSDNYEEPEWAAYVSRMEPNAVIEEFGVDVVPRVEGEGGLASALVPFVQLVAESIRYSRVWLDWGPARVEVWDYWYRKPVWRNGKFVKMETWNVVFAGSVIVRGPNKYPEYDGMIPYVPLFNTFLPGVPSGRPELYDIEPLIREKFEKITAGSQMITAATAGDFWQLVGPEAPTKITAGMKPVRNQVIGPGPGNRIETITPFVAQFQLEQYFGRLDREMAVVSGLNDLLLGLAPAQVLSSSKAINALIANYETRLAMRRKLLYSWRRKNWALAVKVWAGKDKRIADVLKAGGGVLDITDPSLSPRDEMETATRAANLVAAKLWSQRRGMDAVHVDDPETEQDMIREERTDASLFPADVQVMAQLMAALKSLGMQTPASAQQQVQGQLQSGQADMRTAGLSATPDNTTASQGPDQQGQTPAVPGQPPEAGGPPTPFAQGPAQTPGAPGDIGTAQTMIQGGVAKSRIMTQQQLGRRGP